MQIFDTHCHYNLEPLVKNWQEHWQAAQAAGVSQSMVVGVNYETSLTAVEISQAAENLYAAIGIHPTDWSENPGQDVNSEIEKIAQLLLKTKTENSPIKALGETGLDYYWLPDNGQIFQEQQKKSLRDHLKLGLEHTLPVILHVRDKTTPEQPTEGNAYWDLISILSEFQSLPKLILHCISGPLAYLKKSQEYDVFVGVAGNVTYPSADHIRSLVLHIPDHRILLETDAPFLPPQTYRGQTCEPKMISKTAEFMESFKPGSTQLAFENALNLFSAD